ncbi:hypothetical protein [Streptomyces sp. BE303]|uniref:hypothetical protein n=1 Tax=Streptomyces sp. BE303 TaxID=3002528 RepID=UPI002E7A8BC0|nr:hypothetical protein [Streptomyces sp. BE303]MED7948550.1 hypothetical protein [Streptomyces sp. BE303]
MLESPLAADVPPGEFLGATITVHSARSKSAKLRAGADCPQFRARDTTTAQVPLNA